MTILVTGAAGFIGSAVSHALVSKGGKSVLGIDNINNYYDVSLKQARLGRLRSNPEFSFFQIDINDAEALYRLSKERGPFSGIIHLAAQVGVRNSLNDPFQYVNDNVLGHVNILELARQTKNLKHLVFASSSSVYGDYEFTSAAPSDPINHPMSLYAATKAADELMGYSYSHLFGIPQTGLRYFTVYGPWGRPDMAIFSFTKAISEGKPIRVFNEGDMQRDFTYIDDIVDGTILAFENPPSPLDGIPPFRIFNLGRGNPEQLCKVISLIEDNLGKKAKKVLEPMQPGDRRATLADISVTKAELGYNPKISIEEGIVKFINWYRDHWQAGSR